MKLCNVRVECQMRARKYPHGMMMMMLMLMDMIMTMIVILMLICSAEKGCFFLVGKKNRKRTTFF